MAKTYNVKDVFVIFHITRTKKSWQLLWLEFRFSCAESLDFFACGECVVCGLVSQLVRGRHQKMDVLVRAT